MTRLISLLVFLFSIFTSTAVSAQNSTCIFCRIANDKIQETEVVYRSNNVVAFMSHGPINPGHVIVIPVVHADDLLQVPDPVAAEMMTVAKKIALAIRKTDLRCEAFRFQSNAGKAAGQTVPHCHLHIIPLNPGDAIIEHQATKEELEAVAEKIRIALKE